LLISIIKNKYFFPKSNHFIGHVSAELNCTVNGKKERLFMGQSSNSLDGFKNYIGEGYGFSLLNMPRNNYLVPLLLVPGKLDVAEGSSEHFDKLIKEDIFGLISFRINERSCMDTASFMKEYGNRTLNGNKAGNNYGFGADPRKFEGAGCAPFVQSLLEISNLKETAEEMNQVVFLPDELLGNPKKDKVVSLWDLFVSDIDMSLENVKFKRFPFPDPQKLFDKLKNIHSGKLKPRYPIIQKGMIGKETRYLMLDATLSQN
jgi:hypothetical protein